MKNAFLSLCTRILAFFMPQPKRLTYSEYRAELDANPVLAAYIAEETRLANELSDAIDADLKEEAAAWCSYTRHDGGDS